MTREPVVEASQRESIVSAIGRIWAASMVVGLAGLIALALWRIGSDPRNQYEAEVAHVCASQYARAQTSADSAAVDHTSPRVDLDSAGPGMTCAELRKTGSVPP